MRATLISTAAALLLAAPALGQLEWRVSVKIILNPDCADPASNPERCRPCNGDPDGDCDMNTVEKILLRYEGEYGNGRLVPMGRGYEFRVVEIVDLYLDPAWAISQPPPGLFVCFGGDRNGEECGGAADCPGGFCLDATHWFDAPVGEGTRDALELAALADYGGGVGPNRFEWNPDAMNVYVLGSQGSGYCSRYRAGSERHVIIMGQDLWRGAESVTPFHEAGHYLGLCHTHGCTSGNSECEASPCAGWVQAPPGDDIDDTIADKSCWSRDEVACYNFGGPYANLPSVQQERVLDVFDNVMSYHPPPQDRLTDDQLDRMADVSNGVRYPITNGLTHFVDGSAVGPGDGSSSAPYPTLVGGIVAASLSGTADIILLRSGAYDESVVISFPVALRASRGVAVIGE